MDKTRSDWKRFSLISNPSSLLRRVWNLIRKASNLRRKWYTSDNIERCRFKTSKRMSIFFGNSPRIGVYHKKKCERLHLCSGGHMHKHTIINFHSVHSADEVEDLGFIIVSDLKFDRRCALFFYETMRVVLNMPSGIASKDDSLSLQAYKSLSGEFSSTAPSF